MKRIALALSLLATSISATASQQEGKISQLSIKANGFTYFYMTSGTRTEKPACATMPYFVIKDENSVAGQAQYSALLAAYTAKKTVRVIGLDSCTRWGDGEDVEFVHLLE